MDSRRVALRSPVCGTDVFLLDHEPILSPKVHVSDLPARHAPKDLNPDQLGWNQSCYRYTRDTHLIVSGSRETRTHKSRSRPPVFKTGSSSGRMTSDCKLRELESNQRPPGSEPGVTTNSNYPASFGKPRQRALVKVRNSKHSVRESHPICELQRLTPRLRAGESALRESNPPRQVGSLEPLPLGQGHML